MNWLTRIAYSNPLGPPTNERGIADIIQGTIDLQYDGSDGGWSFTQLQNMSPQLQPQACQMIQAEAKVRVQDPAATAILRILSAGANCPDNPENPPADPTMMGQDQIDPNMMPMIGQQEKPTNMPSTEFE